MNSPMRWMIGSLLAASLVVSAGCFGGGSAPPKKPKAGAKSSRKGSAKTEYGYEAERPKFETIECRVYTPEPGFLVLIDGVEARTDDGKPLLTPCEVGIPDGEHSLMLIREKHEDYVENVLIASPRDFEIKPTFKPFEAQTGYLESPFAKAKVGEPISLTALNTGGRVFDPFLADGGLTLYFAGDRQAGRGIYFAKREAIYEPFGEPELIPTTRGADVPASPSLTADGELLVYSAVDQARIWAVEKAGDTFSGKRELRIADTEDDVWLSAQISADGQSLYCVQERKGDVGTYVTSREDLDEGFRGKWEAVDMPGDHPVITSDGLRQFSFDGKTVTRVSRQRPQDDWSKPTTVAELDLPRFKRNYDYRQFCVSDDEQWLIYTDDPEAGNLSAVRIADGPRWGFVPRGRSVPQKDFSVAATDTEPEPATSPATKPDDEPADKPGAPPVDPRTLPLPYSEFRRKLEGLVLQWDFAAAEDLIQKSLADPKHEKDKPVIEWDREALQWAREFTEEAARAARQLKVGEEVRVGLSKMTVTIFKEGALHGKAGDKDIVKPLRELTPNELLGLAERTADKTNETFHLRVAAYFSFQPKPSTSMIASRLTRAGVSGRTFQERIGRRKLHLISQEFERENIPVGLKLVDEVVAAGSRTETATEALRLKDDLFRRPWEQIGGREWDSSTPGEYVGRKPNGPSEGSYLLSAREYENFHLQLEWKTVGGPPAQGGVFFRYPRGKPIREAAYKVHFANDANGTLDKYSTGSLFRREPPKARAVKPEGQWNTFVMRVEKDKVKATINGTEVLDTALSDAMIPPKGHVALDGEFVGIAYRKILLYELPGK